MQYKIGYQLSLSYEPGRNLRLVALLAITGQAVVSLEYKLFSRETY